MSRVNGDSPCDADWTLIHGKCYKMFQTLGGGKIFKRMNVINTMYEKTSNMIGHTDVNTWYTANNTCARHEARLPLVESAEHSSVLADHVASSSGR